MIISTFDQRWPLKHVFTISRDSRTYSEVLGVRIVHDGVEGVAECVPNIRYGETLTSVLAQIHQQTPLLEGIEPGDITPTNLSNARNNLLQNMAAGAARNALDCALWDLQAKISGISVAQLLDLSAKKKIISAQTIGLGTEEETQARACEYSAYPLLKVKVGVDNVLETIALVHAHARSANIIVDANEAWSFQFLCNILPELAKYPVVLIEQPLKAAEDADLVDLKSPIPICADESLHTQKDLTRIKQCYDCVNIKLDKAGGLTEGMAILHAAKASGLKVMIGCMVGTSLSMSPAYLLAQMADFVDLDGPALLAGDYLWGFSFSRGIMVPDSKNYWGVG